MKIEFLYFDGCPNHQKAYELLQQVLREKKIDTVIEQIEIKDDKDAARHKFVGSPTIRVNGVDVDPVRNGRPYAKTCRLYLVHGKLSGLPTKAMIENAIAATRETSGSGL